MLNSCGGALGAPHTRRCGIPKGYSLSMCFIALLLRPWILQMESIGAMARTLADDILLLTKGGRALNLFHEAFNLTMVHLHDLGGKVAPAKSLLFATCVRHRHWLRRHVWIPLGQTVTVVAHFRNFGAQLTATNRVSTAQSKVRFWRMVSRLCTGYTGCLMRLVVRPTSRSHAPTKKPYTAARQRMSMSHTCRNIHHACHM